MNRAITNCARKSLLFASLFAGSPSGWATGHVSLKWDPVGQPDVSYHVYYGTQSQTYSSMLSAGPGTSADILGLDEGSTYYFAIAACDGSGTEGDYAPEVSRDIPWSTAAGSNWLAQLRGNFNGLFRDPQQTSVSSAGSFSLTLNRGSAYSGRLRLGASSFSITGRFDSQGLATNLIRSGAGSPLALELRVGSGDEVNQISGRLIGGQWTSQVWGAKSLFNTRTNPALSAGVYTLALANPGSDPSLPNGCSYGTARVSTSGLISFAGALADGTRVAQAASLSDHALWPLHIPLYGGRGFLRSWLTFNPAPGGDFSGVLAWIKQSNPQARYYPNGFTNDCQAVGSIYLRPLSPGATLLNPPLTVVSFYGGNLASDLQEQIELGPFGRVSNQSASGLTMSFSLTTGLFRGTLIDPVTLHPLSFGGAVLTKANTGFGLLLGGTETSRVIINP